MKSITCVASAQVQLYGVCSLKNPVCIIQEYMPCGNLLDLLQNDAGKKLKFEDLIFIAFQVAEGMQHLESLNFIHRDLAARNVLMGPNNVAKIADFGLARLLENNVYSVHNVNCEIPIKWTAPEALTKNVYTTKSDVWAYGVLLMELFTYGATPYNGVQSGVVFELVRCGYRMPKPETLPEEIYNVMLRCWHEKPNLRPTFQYLKRYFEGIDVVYPDKQTAGSSEVSIELRHDIPAAYEDREISFI